MATFQALQEAIRSNVPIKTAQENLDLEAYNRNKEAYEKSETKRIMTELNIEVIC